MFGHNGDHGQLVVKHAEMARKQDTEFVLDKNTVEKTAQAPVPRHVTVKSKSVLSKLQLVHAKTTN